MSFKYTVVIPCRNRQRYCVEAIQSVTQHERDDVQIIVLDNSDDGTLKTLLEEQQLLEKTTYLPPEDEVLSMDNNWERAIDLIEGEWTNFIGDDDGFTPNTLGAFDFLVGKYNFRAFRWNLFNYKWPCYPTHLAGRFNYAVHDTTAHVIETKIELEQAFNWQNGDKWPRLGPSVYHGLVDSSLVKEIKADYGKYFVDPCTDYASSLLNAARIDAYMKYGYPLTVMGACKPSNTALQTGITSSAHRKEVNTFYTHKHKDLKGSNLLAPAVAESFANIFGYLKMDFKIAPEKLAQSCFNELTKIREPNTFNNAKKALVKYAKKSGLNTAPIESLKCRPGLSPLGYFKDTQQIYIDTMKLSVSGIIDLGNFISALQLPFEEDGFHQQLYLSIKKQRQDLCR